MILTIHFFFVNAPAPSDSLEFFTTGMVHYFPFYTFFEGGYASVSKKIHQFLITSGSILLILGIIRLYRVIRMHQEDPLFAPHLLGASLSAWISYSLLKIGLKKKELNRKGAISLIRSGSVLLAIWSYRFYIFLQTPGNSTLPIQAYLAPFYVVFGTIVMCIGLKISRGIRKNMKESALALSEEITKKDHATKLS